MLEKTLKFAALPFGMMAFALTYIYLVETLNCHSLFAGALALIIATITGFVYLFSLLQLPSMLLFIVKDSKKLWRLTKVKFGKNKGNTVSKSDKTPQKDLHNEVEIGQANQDNGTVIGSAKEIATRDKWQEAKDFLLDYTKNGISPYFPEKYHPNLLQLIEDFASNNIACSSPVLCTKDELKGLTAIDICHFIGNLLLKFKYADKHKVMNRHSACQFAMNAFPNIVTQAHSFVYAKLVQYDEYNKIESFAKKDL